MATIVGRLIFYSDYPDEPNAFIQVVGEDGNVHNFRGPKATTFEPKPNMKISVTVISSGEDQSKAGRYSKLEPA